MRKAFVTGATGFIGASIARALLREGCRVTVLARRGSDRRNLTALQVEVVEGDLRDADSLMPHLKKCDILFHAAADYRLWTPRPEEMYDVNVGGTRALLTAALRCGVEKVIYTSSVGTLGTPGNGIPGTEKGPVHFSDMVGDYKKSKFLAEREAENICRLGLPVVIVNPSTPVGEFDIKPTPTGKIIVDFLNRRMPAYIDTGLNLIDVEDCAAGHLLAARYGRVGERYILGNQNLSLSQIFCLLQDISGLPAPRIRLPYLPVLAAAYANEAIARLTRREPLIPLAGVRMAGKYMYFDSSKAVTELGLPQSSVRDALAKAVNWFCTAGYVK